MPEREKNSAIQDQASRKSILKSKILDPIRMLHSDIHSRSSSEEPESGLSETASLCSFEPSKTSVLELTKSQWSVRLNESDVSVNSRKESYEY